jgi:hypothetical protein
MLEKINQYFHQQGWKYAMPENTSTVFLLGVSTKEGKFKCVLDVREEESKFIFFTIFSEKVPENQRLTIAELLMKINYTLFSGSFDMDFTDGQVRFKTSLMCESSNLTFPMIDYVVKGNISVMAQYSPLIHQYIKGEYPSLDNE